MKINTKNQAILLIELVCKHYNITDTQLRKGKKITINKNGDQVKLSEVRMALSYFLYKYCPLRLTEIALLTGYSKHSTISTYRRVVDFYIEKEDPHFFPYYLKTIELASDINISMRLEKVSSRSPKMMFRDYDKILVL